MRQLGDAHKLFYALGKFLENRDMHVVRKPLMSVM